LFQYDKVIGFGDRVVVGHCFLSSKNFCSASLSLTSNCDTILSYVQPELDLAIGQLGLDFDMTEEEDA
jgi:hypothetical protein